MRLRSRKLNNQFFPGFPARSRFIPLPDLFFTTLLSKIDSLVELKLVLHIFWRLYQKKGHPKFVTYSELLADRVLVEGVGGTGAPAEVLSGALESAVNRGVLLYMTLDREGERQDLYFINTEPNRKAIADLQGGELSLDGALPAEPCTREDSPTIFTLYEQNIGLLTPMIAEELKEAEKLYPISWIEEAFKEAVDLNKRNWRYISRILERWFSEGKESGKFRRHSKEEKDPDRYIKGKYGHVVRR